MASTSNQTISSSSASPCWKHDVFLNFRGVDTRKTFIDHLDTALRQAGIRAFLDDSELRKGEDISSEFLRAIEQSRIAIVVLSENYASSRWCLNELVQILECKKTKGQLLLPIFYHVDPSHVRHQTGSFANAFVNHRNTEKVDSWRAALTQVANFSGWDLQNIANGHESKFILKIVEDVTSLVKNYTPLDIAFRLVNIDCRVEDVKLLLSTRSNSVSVIGIHGMGGVGKTTIAKTVYNSIFLNFESSCSLENVREILNRPNGLAHLQEKLVSSILMTKNLKVDSVDRGTSFMKERFSCKRVLIVFDDLDDLNQVKLLVGQRDWLGSGSIIIITTRDEHLLNWIQVDKKYEVKELNFEESLELFSWHAFKEHIPRKDYVGLANTMASHCRGLPLALEVLGSSLYGRTTEEWENTFQKIQQIPNPHIQNKLRISFDGLDDNEKEIFLDVANFFIGMHQDRANTILDACDLFPKIGLRTLREKCLLTVNERNELGMHDLLRDMGREIVREEYPREPRNRSRLWFQKDVIDVLQKHKGTDSIQGIILDPNCTEAMHLTTQSFEKMHKLRLLKINSENVQITGSFEHKLEELRWLCWKFCPLICLPSSFHPENLAVLEFSFSKVNKLWEGAMVLENLKILDLSWCTYLTTPPDCRGLLRLEKLILLGCTRLDEVHPSVGLLSRLVDLNLVGCVSLTSLPVSIYNMRSLQNLNLSKCEKLEGLPQQLGNLENLKVLNLSGSNWGKCNYLGSGFSPIKRVVPLSILNLCSLVYLNLSWCIPIDRDISNDIGSLSSLKQLDLCFNVFRSLPSSLGQLWNLTTLNLFACRNLQSFPKLPPKLEYIDARYCTSLEQLPNVKDLQRLRKLILSLCVRLSETLGLETLTSFPNICLSGCDNLKTLIKVNIEFCPRIEFWPPRMEIPDLFNYQKAGSSISFEMPLKNNFLGFTVCVIIKKARPDRYSFVLTNKTNGTNWCQRIKFRLKDVHELFGNVEFCLVMYIPKEDPIQGEDQIEITFTSVSKGGYCLQVERIGVHLEYESSHLMKIDDRDDNVKRGRECDFDHLHVVEASRSSSSSSKRLKV